MLLQHQSKHDNLYLPGLAPDGGPRTLVHIPGYWHNQLSNQHAGGAGDAYEHELGRLLLQHGSGRMAGLARLDEVDARTGRVIKRVITHNVETDAFLNRVLAEFFGSTGDASAAAHLNAGGTWLGQYLSITPATATAATNGTVTVSSVFGAVTGYPVVSGGAAALVTGIASSTFKAAATVDGTLQNTGNAATGVPTLTGGKYPGSDNTFGTGIILGFGTANAEVANGSTTTSLAAQIFLSGSSTSQTNYTTLNAHASGDFVVAGPSSKDGPTTAPTGAQISTALVATYTAGAGVGNRKAQLQFTFTTAGGFTAGSYTDLWVINVSSTGSWTAANNAYAHVVNAPLTLNSSTNLQATYTAIF